jgi:DNA-binding IclR family transcriptional regulator
MNVEHITADPERTRRHAALDAIPEDRDRLPVSLRALARAEQLPYSTVRRRVSALVARRVAEEGDGGVIVPARVLGSEAMARSNMLNVQRVEKLFADLKRLGCDATRPRASRHEERCAN